MTLEEAYHALKMQEEILQFAHFNNDDAWELGCQLVSECKFRKLPALISIRRNNGCIIFQHALPGTCPENEKRIEKKFETVRMLEMSTMRLCMEIQMTEDTPQNHFTDLGKYASGGGGFPILIEDVGCIGAICISSGDHTMSHEIIVKTIGKYLHVDELPRIGTLSF